MSGGSSPAHIGTWDAALAHILRVYEADDSSATHARLRIALPHSQNQPEMVWRGTSSIIPGKEAIHIASPIAHIDDCDLVALASEVDTLPFGALRVMDGLIHLHETLLFPGLTPEKLDAAIRLIAAEAGTLARETSGGK